MFSSLTNKIVNVSSDAQSGFAYVGVIEIMYVDEGRNYCAAHVSRLARAGDGCFSAEAVGTGVRLNIPQKSLGDV